MEFKNSKFIINVDFSSNDNEMSALCSNEDHIIYIDIKRWIENRINKGWKLNNLDAQIRSTVIHELTHWFEENCFRMYRMYDSLDLSELFATFNETFLYHIYEFTDMIVEHIYKKKYLK